MRILVTGARGQLGRDVVEHASAHGDDVTAVDSMSLDITRREFVHEAVAELRPDLVVNCAAMTAVDACESRIDEAMSVNGDGVRWLAEACDATGARLIQISTDYVFDGSKATPYVEDDETNPLSVYGRSKLAGEHAALDLGDSALVVRTSWVCGAYGSNMVKTILRLVDEERELAFVDDQIGHPTFSADLANMVLELGRDRASGIFHVTNSGAVSWYEFVRAIVEGIGGDPSAVRPIRTVDLDPPRPAPRPANGVLANRALERAGYPAMRHFESALAELLADLAAGRGRIER